MSIQRSYQHLILQQFFKICISQGRLIFLHWITSLKRMSETLPNLIKLKNFGYLKKAGVVLNFCLIRIIYHIFLVLRMIESACKTFMSIQTLVLHIVDHLCIALSVSSTNNMLMTFHLWKQQDGSLIKGINYYIFYFCG